jgi:hypothetical protein
MEKPPMSALPRDLDDMPHRPVSQFAGWRELAQSARANGGVAITEAGHVELVVLTATQYQQMAELAGKQAALAPSPALEALEARYTERLSALQAPDMRDRVNGLLKAKGRFSTAPMAGESF